MKKSKFIAVLTVAAFTLMLAACDNGSNTTDDENTPAGTVVDPTSENPKTDENPKEDEPEVTEHKYAACFDTPYHFLESIITDMEVEKSPSASVKASKFSNYSREAVIDPSTRGYVNVSQYEGAYEYGIMYTEEIKEVLLQVDNLEFNKEISIPTILDEKYNHLIIVKEGDTQASLYWTFSGNSGDGNTYWQVHKVTNYVNDNGDFCSETVQYWGNIDELYIANFTRNENLVTYCQVMDKDCKNFNYSSKDKDGLFKTIRKQDDEYKRELSGYIDDSNGGIIIREPMIPNGLQKKYVVFDKDYTYIYSSNIFPTVTEMIIPLYALTGIDNVSVTEMSDEDCTFTEKNGDAQTLIAVLLQENSTTLPEGCTFSKQAYVDEKITQADALLKDFDKLVAGLYPTDVAAAVKEVTKYKDKITILGE